LVLLPPTLGPALRKLLLGWVDFGFFPVAPGFHHNFYFFPPPFGVIVSSMLTKPELQFFFSFSASQFLLRSCTCISKVGPNQRFPLFQSICSICPCSPPPVRDSHSYLQIVSVPLPTVPSDLYPFFFLFSSVFFFSVVSVCSRVLGPAPQSTYRTPLSKAGFIQFDSPHSFATESGFAFFEI